MADWGVKVALQGYDVHTALPHQCSIHSGYPCLKTWSGYREANAQHPAGFYLYGTITIDFVTDPPNAVATEVYKIQHDLGPFTPAYIVRGKLSSGPSGVFPIEPTGTLKIYATSDPTYFRIMVYRETGWGSLIGDSLTFYYMIFGDAAA